MNNKLSKQNMAGMGALPLIILFGLIVGAGYLLVAGDLKIPFFEDKKNVEVRRLEGYPVTVGINKKIEKKRAILRSEEELIDFLASIDNSNDLTVGEKINFNKEYLVAVTSKSLENGGHEFKIKKVYIDKEKDILLVSSRLKKPSDDCITTQELNMMVDIVAISKTDKEVEFETLIETFTCSDD